MKKKIENRTCSLIRTAVITLVLNPLIIALGAIYGCSSDGEYEEPWLTKEHKTRAALDMNLMMEPPLSGNFVIQEANGSTCVYDSVNFKVDFYWPEIDGDNPSLAEIIVEAKKRPDQNNKQVTRGPKCIGTCCMHNGAHCISYHLSYTYKKYHAESGQWSDTIPRSYSGYYPIPEEYIHDHTGDF